MGCLHSIFALHKTITRKILEYLCITKTLPRTNIIYLFKIAKVFNVGWLDNHIEYTQGNTPFELIERLFEILNSQGDFLARVNQIRGVHTCNFCGADKFQNSFIGSCELWIPGADGETYFAAPSLIIHYIQEHNYCPPKNFIESALKLNMKNKFNGQKLYDDLLKENLA